MGKQFAFSLCDRADTDGHLSSRRCEFEGVGEQVEEYFFDLRLVETNLICFRQLIIQRETDLPVARHALEGVIHLADKGGEIETGLLQDRFTGLVFLYIHQVVDQEQHPSGVLFDQLERLLDFGRERDVLHQVV